MDKVVSKQTQFKRALEKQLDDIEVSQRQTEARRLKQIRDLGVDLSRIQSTSRHLEYIEDFTPRRHQQRRGSLPAAAGGGSGDLTLNLEPSRESRSRRRLSCIAAIPLISSDNEETPEMSADKKDQHRVSNKTGMQGSASPDSVDLPVNKEDNNDVKSKTSLADRKNDSESVDTAARRGSSGGNSNNDGHNVTTVYIHEDKQTSQQDSESSGDNSPEEGSQSPDIMRRRERRASEPAVGGYFIRRLQATVYNDTQSVQQRSTVESAELRRSIQKYLPSDIVAEEDEEEGDAICISRSTEDLTRPFSSSMEKLDKSLTVGKGPNGSQYKGGISSQEIKIKDSSKDKPKTSKGNQTPTKPGIYNPSRPRRNSDGDVLTYIARKFHKDGRGQGHNSPGNSRVLSAASRNKNSSVEANNENNDVWQAVRKCRYLRGYDPPEMTEPVNMREFVFGHENIDSLPPESK